MAVRLSAFRAGRLLHPQEESWYSFLLKAESTQVHSAAGRIRSIEKSNDPIGIRSRDLQACSIMPQPSTLPRAPISKQEDILKKQYRNIIL
jgi:hypothetical protein